MTKYLDKRDFTKVVESVISILEDNKAVDIAQFDLGDVGDPAYYIVVASASSVRHARALMDNVVDGMRAASSIYDGNITVEGSKNGQWILVDLVGVVVHIFQAEPREYYDIDGLFSDAQRIDK